MAPAAAIRLAGLVCGSALCMASASQQLGMANASTAKAGFITALYVVLVPILSVVLGKRPEAKIWACVVIAVVGLYLLCIKPGGFALAAGDGVLLLCAFLFAVGGLGQRRLAAVSGGGAGAHGNHGQQNHHSDPAAAHQIGEWAHKLGPKALRHKGGAPQKCCQQQHQQMAGLFFHASLKIMPQRHRCRHR